MLGRNLKDGLVPFPTTVRLSSLASPHCSLLYRIMVLAQIYKLLIIVGYSVCINLI